MMQVEHLPYQINPSFDRNHHYETLWKEKALALLRAREPDLNGWTLLDYGSGRGETLKMASEMGMLVRGTDLDPECVRLSSEFGDSIQLDLSDPVSQLGKKAYDVVACFHVLEHVPCPVETLNHLVSMARRYVLLAVPNLAGIPDLLRSRRNVYAVNEGHLQSWDHSHFLNLTERHCGLKHLEWAFDHVKIPIASNLILKFFGQEATIKMETGIFRKMFPFQATSIIGIFEVL